MCSSDGTVLLRLRPGERAEIAPAVDGEAARPVNAKPGFQAESCNADDECGPQTNYTRAGTEVIFSCTRDVAVLRYLVTE